MMKKLVILLTVLIVGSLMINSNVDAAPGDHGKPFEKLWNAIGELGQTLGTTSCEDGQILKWHDASGQWVCAIEPALMKLNTETVNGDLVIASIPKLHKSTAECPPGTVVTGGGYRFFGFSDSVEGIIVENAQLNERQWRVQFSYDKDGSGSYIFTATVNCASITP